VFDARRAARLDVSLHAVYVTDDLVVDGVACDLSRNGVFLHAPDCDAVGSTGTLKLSLPDEEIMEFCASVIRVESGQRKGMGLAFDLSAHPKLANYLMTQHANVVR
jgi:PilZ domain